MFNKVADSIDAKSLAPILADQKNYVGGAIEKAMAEEIYNQLQSGLLDYAANLTNDAQLSSFCDWLVTQ